MPKLPSSKQITKVRKFLLLAGVCLLLIQLPWFFVVQAIVNRTQTKVTATVVRIENMENGCTGRYRRSFCDRSPRQYPVYEYFDESGQRYEQDDRFFGEYKQNNPLRKVFWKEVGETVPAYYTNNKPGEALFMGGPFSYAAWLIPLYVAVIVFIAFAALVLVNKLRGLTL